MAAAHALVLEVAVDNGHLQALRGCTAVRSVRAGDCVVLRDVAAHEAGFQRAGRRAAVAGGVVAVVAGLAHLHRAITARDGARLILARGVAAARLLGAGLRAPGRVAEKQTVRPLAAARQVRRIGAAIAALVPFLGAITAGRDCAGALAAGRASARRTRLDLADRRAAVAAGRVAVVAGLDANFHPVTASGNARPTGRGTEVASRGASAIRRATVTADGIAVIANLDGHRHDAVATGRGHAATRATDAIASRPADTRAAATGRAAAPRPAGRVVTSRNATAAGRPSHT